MRRRRRSTRSMPAIRTTARSRTWTRRSVRCSTPRRSRSRPTTVVVTADHGEGLGDHGELTHGLLAYETTLRVPLIITQLAYRRTEPETEPPTESSRSFPARHVDLVPTLLDAVRFDRAVHAAR